MRNRDAGPTIMAGVALGAFFWAVRRGQFDDLDTPRYRALFDNSDAERGVAQWSASQVRDGR